MDAEPRSGSLVEGVRDWVRERAEAALTADGRGPERLAETVFRSPSPLRAFAATEVAKAFANALPQRTERLRRMLNEARAGGAAPYAVIGDSHSTQLVRRGRRGGRWLLPFHGLCTGASARGLANPEAAAGAGGKVAGLMQALQFTPMPVLFKFGQVDVEFVFTFKRLETGAAKFDAAAFDAFAAETVERYIGFLEGAVPAWMKPLVRVAGVFPPALSDIAWRRGYVDAHITALHGPAEAGLETRLAALELPDLAARTRLHAAFNARLAQAAEAAGYGSFGTFASLLGPGGVVYPRYLGRAAGRNHHLAYAETAGPISDVLWETV